LQAATIHLETTATTATTATCLEHEAILSSTSAAASTPNLGPGEDVGSLSTTAPAANATPGLGCKGDIGSVPTAGTAAHLGCNDGCATTTAIASTSVGQGGAMPTSPECTAGAAAGLATAIATSSVGYADPITIGLAATNTGASLASSDADALNLAASRGAGAGH